MKETIKKYNEWKACGGPPYLTDEEVLSMLEFFDNLKESLAMLSGYSIAMRAATSDWYNLHLIAHARGLKK